MKTRNITGLVLSAALLFTGCLKDDIDELRKQQAENAERIAALEQWQTTVNGNINTLQGLISSLQDNDYVTGVVPFETPAPGGCRITFAENGEVVIWNGVKGETGEAGHSPVIAVKQDTDNQYYWTLDGNWITDGAGNKVPVTGPKGADGTDGKSPKVAVGNDGYWYISGDGTATGTPPGAGWTDTGVQATGPQGDAIFADEGISQTDDYVEFTLADNLTKIRIPKYKSIGISFTQPDLFAAGTAQEIVCSSTGSAAPTVIRIVDLPAGWKAAVDIDNIKITITPPAAFTAENFSGEATVLVGVANQVAAMYPLILTGDFSGVTGNVFGAVYYRTGKPIGMVYIVNDGNPGTGRVVSLDEFYSETLRESCWSLFNKVTNATSTENGLANMKTIYDLDNSFAGYPAFAWVHALNPTGATYSADATDIWYLLAINELDNQNAGGLYRVFNGYGKSAFNNLLKAAGGTILEDTTYPNYWSSTEFDGSTARLADFNNAYPFISLSKNNNNRVRAILAF